MSKRSIVLEELPLTKQDCFLRIEVFYSLGGNNYFTGGTDPRGISLSVQKIKHETHGISFVLWDKSGVKTMILPCSRFSQKKLQEAADSVKDHPMRQKLIDYILLHNTECVLAESPEKNNSLIR